jgi:hypothetical protein
MLINEKLTLNLTEQEVTIKSIDKELERIGRQNIFGELNKLRFDPNSWYKILTELRNKSIHRNILTKKAAVNISENINNNTSSSTVKNYLLLPPDYKDSMKQEITEYLGESIDNMRNLIDNTKKVAGI